MSTHGRSIIFSFYFFTPGIFVYITLVRKRRDKKNAHHLLVVKVKKGSTKLIVIAVQYYIRSKIRGDVRESCAGDSKVLTEY